MDWTDTIVRDKSGVCVGREVLLQSRSGTQRIRRRYRRWYLRDQNL